MRAADEAAFVDFARTAQPRLRRTAYLMCGDWHLASDHVQEGLIRVYARWPRLTRRGGELAYARKAVVSAVLDARRRRSSSEVPTEAGTSQSSSEDVASSVAARAELLGALRRLPPRQRACVVLRYFEDLDVAATAEALGCSEGTVKSQTAKALRSLRSMFAGSPVGELVVVGEGSPSWSTS